MTLDEIEQVVAGDAAREERAAAVAELIRRSGDYRWVGLYDVGETEVAILAWSGGGPPAHPRFPRTRGLTGAAVAAGETLVAGDVASDPRYLEAFGDTRSEIIVPVVVDGLVHGTVDVESARAGAFGAEHRAFLERCAAASAPLWR